MKTQGRNPSTGSLILCQVLGMHNRRRQSTTGAVHYCGRCGIVTRDNRRHWLNGVDIKGAQEGARVTFGAGGQEFRGTIEKIDRDGNRVALSQVTAISKWNSLAPRAAAAAKRFLTLAWLRKGAV